MEKPAFKESVMLRLPDGAYVLRTPSFDHFTDINHHTWSLSQGLNQANGTAYQEIAFSLTDCELSFGTLSQPNLLLQATVGLNRESLSGLTNGLLDQSMAFNSNVNSSPLSYVLLLAVGLICFIAGLVFSKVVTKKTLVPQTYAPVEISIDKSARSSFNSKFKGKLVSLINLDNI